MEKALDDLINAIQNRVGRDWRAAIFPLTQRLALDLAAGFAIRLGIAIGLALAG
jgi:hypothetical protein